jgi:hypothetical protein
MKTILLVPALFFFLSCTKYSQPSEPKLSGEWQIDMVEYYRIENGDTINSMVYLPGDLYVNPNDNSPLDTIEVGFTRFHMDYSVISFKPVLAYGGATKWKEQFFYGVSEVSHTCPGFMKFQYGEKKCVWKVKNSSFFYSSLNLELKGQWDPESLGYYNLQSATAYDAVVIRCSNLGP